MSPQSLFLAAPIFFLVYQAVGLFFEAREKQRWEPIEKSQSSSSTKTFLRDYSNLSSKINFNKLFLRHKQFNERLELLLLRSGYPLGWKPQDFLFFKEIIAVVFILMLWRLEADQLIIYFLGAIVGFWIPDLYLKSKGTARQEEIRKKLPGFVDLMALALESGLDLMAAIDRILEKLQASSLKEELAMLLQENRLGTPRKEAFEHLAYRVNLPDIQSLTSMIIQSEELGTSLAVVLRNYSEDMRNRRILRAEEEAGKAPVKLLLPMTIFFFPIVFIVIFGPLALNFMSSYK